MKRLTSLLLTLFLLISLVGCGTLTPSDASVDTTTTTTQEGSILTTTVPVGGNTDPTTTPVAGDTDPATTTGTDSPGTTTTGLEQVGPPAIGTTTTTKTDGTTSTTVTTTTKAPTAEQVLVDKAFALTGSATLKGTLTGTVVNVKEKYSASYGNASFTIQVRGTNGVKELYCYRCKPTGAGDVTVGRSVTVSGTIKNYNGTIEFDKGTYTVGGSGTTVATTTTTKAPFTGSIDVNGIYDSAEEVGLYIHLYGKLPKNYVTKSQYNKDKYLCVGGDRFYNKEGRLPSGEIYYECDIDTYGSTSRGAKRLVWTKSGIVYYTADHYETFTKLYGER